MWHKVTKAIFSYVHTFQSQYQPHAQRRSSRHIYQHHHSVGKNRSMAEHFWTMNVNKESGNKRSSEGLILRALQAQKLSLKLVEADQYVKCVAFGIDCGSHTTYKIVHQQSPALQRLGYRNRICDSRISFSYSDTVQNSENIRGLSSFDENRFGTQWFRRSSR